MGLVDIIKNLFNKKTKVIKQSNNKDIISYDTSAISLPKYSKLSKEAKEKINEYMEEINIEELKSLIEYASELYKNANDVTELLLNLSFEINKKTFGSELNKLSEQETLEKRIEALISLEELKEYYKELYRINDECALRAVALERYRNKEYNRVIEFLGVLDAFKKADKLKREKELDSLENALNELKLCKRRIEYLIETVKKEIGTSTIISISLETHDEYRKLSIENSNINEEQLTKEILENKLKELLLMINHIKNEKIKSIDINNIDSNELIKLIAKYKREIDLYAYQNKDKIKELDSRVFKLIKCQKNLDNKEYFMNLINEIEVMYKVFGSYLQEEHLLNFYELKLDVLCINLDDEELLFKNIKDEQELLYYQKIIELKLDKILNGENKWFQKEFGGNQYKAIGIVRNIIKKENGDFSCGGLLYNTKILAFILAFDKENGLSEFIKKKYFSKKDLVYELDDNTFQWNSGLPLKTIYQLEELIGNIDKKYTSLNPWVKLLNCSNIIIEKIGDVTTEGEVVLTFLLGINILNLNKNLNKNINLFDQYTKKILHILDMANIIILNEELEQIRDYAFLEYENLTKIEIPSTVKSIGNGAFFDCKNLQEVILNEGLEEIREGAFFNCINLKKIKIPATVKKIGNDAFRNCINLQEVILNEGLEKIGERVFKNCRSLKKMEIPSTVKSIEMHAFEDCENLQVVILNEGLEKIREGAFFNCINLKKIKIPATVKKIGNDVFRHCRNLQEVILNEGLEKIGERVFKNCRSLKKMEIPSTVKSIEIRAFEDCENLQEVILNEGLKKIGGGAFFNCRSLKKMEIPSTVKSIEIRAFEDCENLQVVILNEGLEKIGERVFKNCRNLKKMEIPSTVKSIEMHAFEDCENLQEVILNEGLEKIGGGAFFSCINLKKIKIPATVKEIGNDVFRHCINLKEVILNEGLERIDAYAFKDCENLTRIELPSTLKYIDKTAFFECENIQEVILNGCLKTIRSNVFKYCKNLIRIKLSSTVKSIEMHAFEDCENIQEVILNEGLERIDAHAFKGCENLIRIELPSTLKYIDERAFFFCKNLQEVILNKGLERIGVEAFSKCLNLTKIEIPSTVKEIGRDVFVTCENLQEMILNEGLERIDAHAFFNCKNLNKIKIPSTVKEIGHNAFCYCLNLQEIILNEGLEKIKPYAFSTCVSLTKIEIPSTVKLIELGSFAGCKNLQELSVPPNYIKVDYKIFFDMDKQINLIIRGIEIEDGCILAYLKSGINQIKSIEIMDGDVVAVHYDVKKDNTQEIIQEINRKLEEYKRDKNNEINKVKKITL